MQAIRRVNSHLIPLLERDVDTDQIIPARFLKVTDKLGLGQHLFEDWRYLADGSPNPGFVLNQAQAQGGQILLETRGDRVRPSTGRGSLVREIALYHAN